ncbi:MAG: hypothetical protein LLF86_03985 [Nitrospiraceae bacterium]|nr:hypothetical protein [Nitrospiraceae bacterium]
MAGKKQADIVLDLKGDAPALAVIKTRRPLLELGQDQILEVISDAEGVYEEMTMLCDLLEARIISSPGKRRVHRIRIKKK